VLLYRHRAISAQNVYAKREPNHIFMALDLYNAFITSVNVSRASGLTTVPGTRAVS
jgi:hypothetical protein